MAVWMPVGSLRGLSGFTLFRARGPTAFGNDPNAFMKRRAVRPRTDAWNRLRRKAAAIPAEAIGAIGEAADRNASDASIARARREPRSIPIGLNLMSSENPTGMHGTRKPAREGADSKDPARRAPFTAATGG
jgi:hypothetical protein